jgi:hypothetical protein
MVVKLGVSVAILLALAGMWIAAVNLASVALLLIMLGVTVASCAFIVGIWSEE